MRLISSPNYADKSWITNQYDRYVRGNTVLSAPADAGLIRIDEESNLGVAVATDCNARFVQLDPYNGTQIALAESYRNVAVSGSRPLAVTDCLNFGSPEDPDVMWQFAEATRGLKDACAVLGIPVTGGNVSFYNQTATNPILPTPVVGVLGVIDNVAQRIRPGFTNDGDYILLLGETRSELSGSAWAEVVHQHLGGLPPTVDLEAERSLAEFFVAAAKAEILTSAHDLSDGGLAVALVESMLINGVGAKLELEDPFVDLFSESTARAIVTVKPQHHQAVMDLLDSFDLQVRPIGRTGSSAFTVANEFSLDLADLKHHWANTLPAVLGATVR